jgi:alkylation response protein AidB-like acyl-CoA dehydrogenase
MGSGRWPTHPRRTCADRARTARRLRTPRRQFNLQQVFAEAEARYRAARAFVYESWNVIDRAATANQVAGLEPIALVRLAMRHIHDVLSEIATFAHRTARGASLRDSTLQRCYRDAHSGTQHILLADEIVAECGRVLLGITGPTAYWTLFATRG